MELQRFFTKKKLKLLFVSIITKRYVKPDFFSVSCPDMMSRSVSVLDDKIIWWVMQRPKDGWVSILMSLLHKEVCNTNSENEQSSNVCGTLCDVMLGIWHHVRSGQPIRVWEWYIMPSPPEKKKIKNIYIYIKVAQNCMGISESSYFVSHTLSI